MMTFKVTTDSDGLYEIHDTDMTELNGIPMAKGLLICAHRSLGDAMRFLQTYIAGTE